MGCRSREITDPLYAAGPEWGVKYDDEIWRRREIGPYNEGR